jgi:general secretion pathway protein I
MTAGRPARDAGFTLIEALVAMAVLAVAAVGLVRATGGHVDAVAAIEARVAGGIAADTALAEARLGLVPAMSREFGRDWRGVVAARASDDPAIAALTVSAVGGDTRVTLHGFRDTGAAPRDPGGAPHGLPAGVAAREPGVAPAGAATGTGGR